MFFLLYFCKKNGSNMAISDTKFHNKYRIQSNFGEIEDGIMHLSEIGEYVINWKSDKSCC